MIKKYQIRSSTERGYLCWQGACQTNDQTIGSRSEALRSYEKAQKQQKTSLKKRVAVSQSGRGDHHHQQRQELKQQLEAPIVPLGYCSIGPIVHQQIVQHRNPIVQVAPVGNAVNWTPERKLSTPNKINFQYSSSQQQKFFPPADALPSKNQTLLSNISIQYMVGPSRLEAVEHTRKDSQITRPTRQYIEFESQVQKSAGKMHASLSPQIQIQSYINVKPQQRVVDDRIVSSLSNRKKTVVSVSGEGESECSFSEIDVEFLELTKGGTPGASTRMTKKSLHRSNHTVGSYIQ